MSVKRYDFDCYAFYDSARLNVQECDDGDYVLYSDYTALLARYNEAVENGSALSACCCPYQGNGGLWHDERGHYRCGFREKHNALREAVEWERECIDTWEYGTVLKMQALDEQVASMSAARAEVDLLIANEGAANCEGEG